MYDTLFADDSRIQDESCQTPLAIAHRTCCMLILGTTPTNGIVGGGVLIGTRFSEDLALNEVNSETG